MYDLVQHLVENVPFFGSLGFLGTAALLMFTVAFAVTQAFMGVAGLMTYVERKIAGWTQSRIGPNRVGPFGLLQFLADGIKLILKEDVVPGGVDRPIFKMAPYLVVAGSMIALVVVPFGPNLIVADMDLGLLVYLTAGSFVTMGIVMSGWASNNKWSTMGAARSVAQIVSYEIPVGLSLVPPILLAGSLSFQSIVLQQGWAPWQWNMFHSPGMFICAFAYFIAAMAEINRTPFDIPEAESELVSGYNTEYSGMRFGMFFMAEFGNVMLIAIICAVVFLGGWHFPGEEALAMRWFGAETSPAFVDALRNGTVPVWVLFNVIGHGMLMTKASALVVVIVLARWTLPRVRVDQLMNICWKYLVPATIFSTALTAFWMVYPALNQTVWHPGEGLNPLEGHWFFWLGAGLMVAAFVRAYVEEHRAPWKSAVGTAHHRRTEDVEVAHVR